MSEHKTASVDPTEAPKVIWLQRPNRDPKNEWCGNVTWCAEKQNDDDTRYVKSDAVPTVQSERIASLEQQLSSALLYEQALKDDCREQLATANAELERLTKELQVSFEANQLAIGCMNEREATITQQSGRIKLIDARRDHAEEAAAYARQDAQRIDQARIEAERQRDELQLRLGWLERLFNHSWNGVVGTGSATSWQLAGDYRHRVATMQGHTFGEAIDAAIASAKGDAS